MVAPFDIFRMDEEGQLLWCEEAASLEEAKARIQALTKSRRTTYVILSQRTGHRMVVEPESS